MSDTHELETKPQHLMAVLKGYKRHEVFHEDPGVKLGDRLLMREPVGYTATCEVTYITRAKGLLIASFKLLESGAA